MNNELWRIKKLGALFKSAFMAFVDDNCIKLAAALSYYTVFALGPLIIIVISLSGIVFGRDAVQGRVYGELTNLLGPEAADGIQTIIANIQQSQQGTAGAIIGSIILVIGATGVFTEMQDSINYIWSVKAKPKKSWLKFLVNRLLSFSLVVGLGFLLLVSLLLNALIKLMGSKLERLLSDYTVGLVSVLNYAIILVVITLLFAVIFKVLPDAIITWRDATIGAILTACLFLMGKTAIGYYLGKADLGITYGTAASVVILLVWVYYSSIILYFGAEFTKMYALQAGAGIRPKDTAVFIIKKESKEVPTSYLDT